MHHDGDVLLSSVGLATLYTDMVGTVRVWVFIASTLFSESQSSINQTRQNFIAWRQDEDVANLSDYKCNILLLHTDYCQDILTMLYTDHCLPSSDISDFPFGMFNQNKCSPLKQC